MFCQKCGEMLEENATECKNCGTKVNSKEKIKMDGVTAIMLIFSILAFVFGFIIVTTALAKKRGIAYVEYIAIIPALVGIATSCCKLFNAKSEKTTKVLAIVSISLDLFTLLYTFIGFMVFIV